MADYDLTRLDGFAEATVNLAKAAKFMMCADFRGPTDSPPILVWCTNDDISIIPMVQPTDDCPAPDALYESLHQAFMEYGVPRFVAVVVEAYIKQDLDPEKTIQRGDLQKAFLEASDPSVGEVLTVMAFDIAGHRSNTVIAYKYDDSGLPQFDEEIVEKGDDVQGAIADVVSDFQKFVSQ